MAELVGWRLQESSLKQHLRTAPHQYALQLSRSLQPLTPASSQSPCVVAWLGARTGWTRRCRGRGAGGGERPRARMKKILTRCGY